jgi:hypothetical protein
MTKKSRRTHKREEGAILFVAVLILALMGAMGIAALDTATRDREAAGFYNRTSNSFYAAEAAASHARAAMRGVTARSQTPAFPDTSSPQSLGDTALYSWNGATPVYYGDPAFTDPIRYAQDSGVYSGGGNLQQKGQKFTNTLWQINVMGQGADGSLTRVELMETKVLTSGY